MKSDKLWRSVYKYIDSQNTQDHQLIDARFSPGLDFDPENIMPTEYYLPTIKLVFKENNITTEKWISHNGHSIKTLRGIALHC